jgi:catechol 2,3-dioxygenase-like lactoylglutathione lyase family enzyme
MGTRDRARFRHGDNMAMKVPSRLFERTVAFYRDVIGLPVLQAGDGGQSWVFRFGALRLWIDNVPAMTQPELWLEVRTDDLPAAEACLKAHGVVRCDEVEPLPEGFPGFWIAAPGGMIHLVAAESEEAPSAG